jgi:hypothetical protein
MPQRSNAFQRLIRRIYEQIKPEGATLTESAILIELDTGLKREVDVLLELVPVADTPVRIGIECRDRTRKADVGWIDDLIGTYQRLPVDKVIAVSRSGFTPGAILKARMNSIEIRTLAQALDANWPDEFESIILKRFQPILTLQDVEIASPLQWTSTEPPVSVIIAGEQMAPDAFINNLLELAHAELAKLYREKGNEFLDKPERFDETFQAAFEIPLSNTVFVAPDGTNHPPTSIKLHCQLTFAHQTLPLARHLFGSVGITTATDPEAGPKPITLMLVQQPGRPIGKPVAFVADTDENVKLR